ASRSFFSRPVPSQIGNDSLTSCSDFRAAPCPGTPKAEIVSSGLGSPIGRFETPPVLISTRSSIQDFPNPWYQRCCQEIGSDKTMNASDGIMIGPRKFSLHKQTFDISAYPVRT